MSGLRKIAVETFNVKIKELASVNNIKVSYKNRGVYFIQVQLLRFTPEIDVRRVKAKLYELFTDALTDTLLEQEKFWSDVDAIEIEVSDKVVTFTKEHISPDMKEGTLLKELFRKNITLELQEKITIQDRKILYRVEDVAFKKVTKVADTLGDGALVFDIPSTTFDDVAGHKETKERLKEIATLLKSVELLKEFDAIIPRGMLLYGVPGTGKTMLARAFANYAEIPFIATTANELIGFGTNDYDSMRTIFKRAKEYAPSIIFIDEIDTFGTRSSQKSSATINEFLTNLDGFSKNIEENVFIIAATNHKENIDDAILRSGRIELHLEVPPLDREGREFFLKKILKKPSQKGIDLEKLVSYTAGLTGADLEKIGNESALYAIRNNLVEITQQVVIEQINIQRYGKRVTTKTLQEEFEEVAYHEAGHAIVAKVLMPKLEIEQVTIIPREKAQGFVAFSMENKNSSLSKEEFRSRIAISLAGRVAQMHKFKEIAQDTGAQSDLQKATQDAYAMVKIYGMDDEFGNVSFVDVELSERSKELIDKKVIELIQTITQQTQKIVQEHFSSIEKLAQTLLKKEVVYGDELSQIIESR
jgi:ATP-dependent metalloprotease FtsH